MFLHQSLYWSHSHNLEGNKKLTALKSPARDGNGTSLALTILSPSIKLWEFCKMQALKSMFVIFLLGRSFLLSKLWVTPCPLAFPLGVIARTLLCLNQRR